MSEERCGEEYCEVCADDGLRGDFVDEERYDCN